MPTPSHGSDCISKTYPIDCNHCGKAIYVYQCSHESVVLFDSLGGGWPQHICSYWREATPTFAGDIQAIVRMHNREITRIRRQLNPSNVQFVSVNPSEMAGKTITAVMSIRETASRTQRIERLDKWNPIARAALQIDGPVSSYFQITLADTGAQPRNTYIAVVQSDLIDELGLQRNSLVGATVEARNSGELAEWFVTEIVAMEV